MLSIDVKEYYLKNFHIIKYKPYIKLYYNNNINIILKSIKYYYN